jgi:hypothetical protein
MLIRITNKQDVEHTQAVILGICGLITVEIAARLGINPSVLGHLILCKYPADGGHLDLNVQKLHVYILKTSIHNY